MDSRKDQAGQADQGRGQRDAEAISKITWSGGEIKPGEFQLFTISAGPLPTDTKSLEFKAVQTYSNGETVALDRIDAEGRRRARVPGSHAQARREVVKEALTTEGRIAR